MPGLSGMIYFHSGIFLEAWGLLCAETWSGGAGCGVSCASSCLDVALNCTGFAGHHEQDSRSRVVWGGAFTFCDGLLPTDAWPVAGTRRVTYVVLSLGWAGYSSLSFGPGH